MEYSFDKLPPEVDVKVNFGENCRFLITQRSLQALKQGRLRLFLYPNRPKKQGDINNFHLEIDSSYGNIRIFLGGDNIQVKFGENSGGSCDLLLWGNSKIIIGKKTTINGAKVYCGQSEFITGEDCMISDGVLVQCTDHHGLVDLKTGEIYNRYPRKIVLNNHVWLGRNSTLLNSVSVGEGSVIGLGAVVTCDVPAKAIAAGVPARIVKTDVTWSRSMAFLDPWSQKYVEDFSDTVNILREEE